MNRSDETMQPAAPMPGARPAAAPATIASASTRTGGRRDERVFLAIVAAGVFLIASVTLLALMRNAKPAPHPADVPERRLIDFTLTDRSGATVRRADLQGQFLVANFVFTACSIDCLQVNYRMAEIQERTASLPDVRLVSFSVDPRSDTPPMLARFANRFGADTNRWLFLTGEHRTMYNVLEQSLLGPADETVPGVVPGVFMHSDQIALVDAQGQLRALFDGLKPGVTEEVMEALGRLRQGSSLRSEKL